jgi:hypothetical protein
MPVCIHVELAMLSGRKHPVRLGRAASVADLKAAAGKALMMPRSRIVFSQDHEHLHDTTFLLDLVEWLIIADIIDSRATLQLDLQLSMLVLVKPCVRCGVDGRKYCGQCKAARYCSEACQRADWPVNKPNCFPAV